MTVTTEQLGSARAVVWDRRARLNAWTVETIDAIADAIETAGRDQLVRCIIVRGAGEHFSSGDDLHAALAADAGEWAATVATFQRLTRVTLAAPVPVVAAIDGVCIGGALEFAASCDARLATDRSRFGTPEVGIGLVDGRPRAAPLRGAARLRLDARARLPHRGLRPRAVRGADRGPGRHLRPNLPRRGGSHQGDAERAPRRPRRGGHGARGTLVRRALREAGCAGGAGGVRGTSMTAAPRAACGPPPALGTCAARGSFHEPTRPRRLAADRRGNRRPLTFPASHAGRSLTARPGRGCAPGDTRRSDSSVWPCPLQSAGERPSGVKRRRIAS
jgi:Enoyl-CoA hydratase/isomerase